MRTDERFLRAAHRTSKIFKAISRLIMVSGEKTMMQRKRMVTVAFPEGDAIVGVTMVKKKKKHA